MKMQKYRDMAYNNNRGKVWLQTIHSNEVWNKWCKKVTDQFGTKWHPDKNRPAKILTAAIWHFGYANDAVHSKAVRATARRLRSVDLPPERGAGVSKRGFEVSDVEILTYSMPLEFWLLDNFLEHEVRPRMEGASKIE